jgi:hypothetical protein
MIASDVHSESRIALACQADVRVAEQKQQPFIVRSNGHTAASTVLTIY